MTGVKSNVDQADVFANVMRNSMDTCPDPLFDTSAQSNFLVEDPRCRAVMDALRLCMQMRTLTNHDAGLITQAAQMFADTDAAIATDILQALDAPRLPNV